jgi:Flp pilus assembly protein TadG
MSRCRDAGQATVLVAAGLVLAAVVLLAVVTAGSVVVDGARARTAADAAALAGAAEGRDAAAHHARVNGGRLVGYTASGPAVTVTVVVGRGRATARARQDGTWCATEGSTEGPISYTRPPCPSTPG